MVRCLTDAELERISRYRQLEAEALKAAAKSKNAQTRDAYQTIAVAWARLIADIEHIALHDELDDPQDFDFLPPSEGQRRGKPVRR